MSRWFRLDDDVINDPKILLLPEAMRWIWVAFLCIASKNNGALPSIEIVALSLRVKTTKAAEYITRLVTAGLIDKTETGFAPHNWNARQFKSDVSTERVKRFRKQDRNVSETSPQTETETHTEAEKRKPREAALVDDGWPPEFCDLFWKKYPHKIGKPDALKKLKHARNSGAKWDDVMTGLENYLRDKPPDRAWCNPATWINQRRWEDQPAKMGELNGERPHRSGAAAATGAGNTAAARETNFVTAVGNGALNYLEKRASARQGGAPPGGVDAAGEHDDFDVAAGAN